MYTDYLLLNALSSTDITFFLICLGLIVVAIAVYFLIPVFNKSQYQERRENLRKREAAFNHNRVTTAEVGGHDVSADRSAEAIFDGEDNSSRVDEAAHDVPVSEVENVTED